jgi:nitroimidazol reductase NimA-like FMN-containing flavoprotein (pyridoxamine 5'-phosphate oxidase superfamily)
MVRNPVKVTAFGTDAGPRFGWHETIDRLAESHTYVFATTGPDLAPHSVPVLAVWHDGALHIATSPTSRKARNLGRNSACCVVTSSGGVDLVVRGHATRLVAVEACRSVAGVFRDKYGWDPAVRDNELWAEGAPSAGDPPFAVYRIEHSFVFSFPTADNRTPTRFEFDPGSGSAARSDS